tara:strand:- start:121 stop:609 length:489 start_codon:yes stop_codon:yes gene_type:complete
MGDRINKIKKVILTKPYAYSFIIIVLAYLITNIVINQVYVTSSFLFNYNLKIIIPFIILNLIIAILIGISVNLIWLKFKEYKSVNKEHGLTFLGVFGGLMGGACPGCFVGLFPAFLGLFGITASLSTLPFLGLELQIGSVALLAGSIFLLTNEDICKIPKRR